MNETVLAALEPTQTIVQPCLADNGEVEAEIDEMWSFVQSKHPQRWLRWAIDHTTGDTGGWVGRPQRQSLFGVESAVGTVWHCAVL